MDVTCGSDDDSAPYFLLTGDCDVGLRAIIDFGFDRGPDAGPETRRHRRRGRVSCSGLPAQRVRHALRQPEHRRREHLVRHSHRRDAGGRQQRQRPAGLRDRVDDARRQPRDSRARSGRAQRDVLRRGSPVRRHEDSGPVLYLQLSATRFDSAVGGWVPVFDANSVNKGNTYKYVVQVGLVKPLQLRDPLEDPLLLRTQAPRGA